MYSARSVLDRNRIGKLTNPRSLLDLYRCNWDAGFLAVGYAHFDMDRAEAELRLFFSRQFPNGMIPQIAFTECAEEELVQKEDSGEAYRSIYESLQIAAANITMPPVFGFILLHIYEVAEDKPRALDFLKEMYPKALQFHRYLYENRDPFEEGLVYIHHPWEAGAGDAPVWGDNPEQSAFKLHGEIQDPLFNALLAWSNESMIKIGGLLGENVLELIQWNELTIYSMNEKLWDEGRGIYNARDIADDVTISLQSSSGLMPLAGDIPTQEQAEKILLTLEGRIFGGKNHEIYLCPTFNLLSDDLDFHRNGRGPVQVCLNWLLWKGLLRYDLRETAGRVRRHTLDLAAKYGFLECYDPRRSMHHGAGAGNYACSAALCIDMLVLSALERG
jgi:hypothetical protein